MQNFTAADLAQTTLATLAFALFLLPPGYLLGLASNAFGMRSRSAAEKLLFSLAFSFAATPIAAVLLTRIFSYQVTLAFFLLLAVVAAFTGMRSLSRASALYSGVQRSTWLLLGMMLAWFLLVQLSLADWQIGHRLYLNYVSYDHSVRVPLVEAAARGGVPPRNPFYGLGRAPVLRYFYYWYVVCALPMRLFGLGAKACFDASVFWSGVGLASLIPLFLKYFLQEREALRQKSVIGIALLAVTGLDLLPYAATAYRYHALFPDMEWWDPNQVTSWLGSLLWVPHHVAALTACMAGLLALSAIEEDAPLRRSVWAVAISGLAFASAAGLSVYVTFAFAVFGVLWPLQTLRRKKFKTLATYVAAGAIAALLSMPYLSDLLSKQVSLVPDVGGAGGGEHFASFAIRDFPPATQMLCRMGVQDSRLLELGKIPVLFPVYLLEFGFFALIAWIRWRRDRRSPAPLSRQRRMAWTMLGVGLLTVSVLRSTSSSQNDLGFRGMLIVQFVLLIWAAPIVQEYFFSGARMDRATPWIRAALLGTLVLGIGGTAWQLISLRCYAPLADAGRWQRSERFLGSKGFGERAYWLREGFTRLDSQTPVAAVVQYNPVRDEVLTAHLYSARQAAMGDAFCGSALGGDAGKCRKAFPRIVSVFNAPEAARGLNLDRVCDEFQIDVLVADDADPVWHDAGSWVWTRPSLLANPAMRAISCGTALR